MTATTSVGPQQDATVSSETRVRPSQTGQVSVRARIRAAGASSTQVLLYGILPQVKPALVGLSIYRWDINIRDSTVLGFVGAGGIGVELFRAVNAFAWQSVATVLIVILGVVVVTESLSAYTRGLVR